MEFRKPARDVCPECRELALENRAAAVILVTQVDIDSVDVYGPGGDDRALEETMRVALEMVPILERAWLAFVDVDRHQPRSRFGRDDLPLSAGGEAGTAESAQP